MKKTIIKFDYKSSIFVATQLILILAIASYCGIFGNNISLILFLVAIILGLWSFYVMEFKVSVFPNVKAGRKLRMYGPYRFVRHPIYTAVLLATFSWMLNRPDPFSFKLWAILALVLTLKTKYEEKLLTDYFKEYENYIKKTKRFIPFIY